MSYPIREAEPKVAFRGAKAARIKQAILSESELDITTKSIQTLSDVYSSMSPNDGEVLTYDTTNGWQSEVAASGSPLTTKGDVLTYDTADARLGVGTDGFVLSADSGEATGLKWMAVGGTGTVTSITAGTGLNGGTITASGTIDLANTAVSPASYTNADITVDQQGRITAASNGSSSGSPLTTKGDLFTYTTTDVRLGIGTNDYVLTADSGEASGMKWAVNTDTTDHTSFTNIGTNTHAQIDTHLASSHLALGATSGTAYRGDRGTTAYDHSQVAHAPSGAEANRTLDATPTNGNTTNSVSSDGVYDALVLKADALGADDNYVTDAEKVVIGNTSGANSGDQTSGDFTHDSLTGVDADEHIDWSVSNAKNIHANNYTDTGDTTDHTSFSNIGTNTHAQIDTHLALTNEHRDWSADQGATNIHTGNYTDTTYSVGDGGLTQINFTSADNTKLDGITALADVTSANTCDTPNVVQTITLTGDVTGSGTGSFATTIAVDAVDIPMLSATGTASSSTYLRGDNTWATPAGGSSKAYAHYYLVGAGATGLTNTEVTLTIDTAGLTSGDTSLATNQITINKTGYFNLAANVYLNNSASSRTEYSMWIEKNGTEVAGTRFASYQRGYDSGMSSGVNTILDITSGDYIQIQCIRTDGGSTAGYQDSAGTSVVLTEVG